MPCPYFEPVAKVEDTTWTRPPRLPLGGAYHGICHALSMEDWRPEPETSRELCNVGYARGRCPRFPSDAPADAVRFSAASNANDVLAIQFILEREYFPVDHGLLEYSVSTGAFRDSRADGLLLKQARGFAENHLRSRGPHE